MLFDGLVGMSGLVGGVVMTVWGVIVAVVVAAVVVKKEGYPLMWFRLQRCLIDFFGV